MSLFRNHQLVPAILGLVLVWPHLLLAENIGYPAGAPGVIVVTNAPYNAVPDGVTDCTAALQSAFNNNSKLIYLPNGTYRVTAPLIAANTTYPFGMMIQGQSQTGVVIRLANNSASFASGSTNPVIWLGQDPPQRFGNSIRNLTIDTGSGNPGSIALRYYANNSGCVRDVTLKSSDRQGIAGLDMSYSRANGPNLIKNLKVDGFQKGIWTGYAMESVTFENITLTNQTVVGWLNENDQRVVSGNSHTNAGQVLSIRNLNAQGLTVTAFKNPTGHVVLLDSILTGTGAASTAVAITNGASGRMYVRNLTNSGYSKLIGDGSGAFVPPGSIISEWTSDIPVTIASTANTRLALPIQETPDVPWDDPSTWANIKNFGATDFSNGEGTRYDNDAPAVQAAIDSGATTVFVPAGTYRVLSPILVRGNVRRILGIGDGSQINGGNDGSGVPYSGIVWQIIDGSNPVVVIQDMGAGAAQDCVGVDNQSSRTLVLRDLSLQPPRFTRGSGDLFIENVVARHWEFNPRRVWARQINPEGDGTHLANRGATLWVMGLKTEDWGLILDASGFARTEILGGMIYSLDDARPTPMMRSVNSRLNFSLNEYLGTYGNVYTNLVLEVRNGVTNNLFRGSPSPTYPATWSQKNDGTTADNSGTVGSDITWFTGWNYAVAPLIVTNSFSVTSGNADAFTDPGETVSQNVVLWNSGSLPFTGVTATLATTNPGVTLITGSTAYPDFAAGDQQTNATAFAYRLSKSLTPGAPLTFTLVTTGLTNGTSVTFTNTFTQTVGQTIVNAQTNFYYGNNLPAAIADLATNFFTNTVAGLASPLLDVTVAFRADHGRDGDLTVSVLHPDNTEVLLVDKRGSTGQNFGGTSGSTTNFTLLSDDASVDIYAGGANGGFLFAGTNGYRPESPLSLLDGKSANGVWRLRVADSVSGSNGTMRAWSLRLVTGTNSYAASLYNTAPVASNLTVTVSSLSTNRVLFGSDADGDPLTFQTISLPTNGVLSGFNTNTGAFTYTPNTGYGGLDSFTFRVNDGYSNSLPATVSFTVISRTSMRVASVTFSNATAVLRFAAVAGLSYQAERATNVTFASGLRYWNTNAPTGGGFIINDDFSDIGAFPASAFYRLRYVP